jgi:hypothetical protein
LLKIITILIRCGYGKYWNGSLCGKFKINTLFKILKYKILILASQQPYGSSCTATEQCISALNLICSITCDCKSTQYYSDSITGCGKDAFIY